jgi:hypothetical protein
MARRARNARTNLSQDAGRVSEPQLPPQAVICSAENRSIPWLTTATPASPRVLSDVTATITIKLPK